MLVLQIAQDVSLPAWLHPALPRNHHLLLCHLLQSAHQSASGCTLQKTQFHNILLKVGISTPVSYPKSLAVMRMHLREDLQLTKTMLTIFVVFLVTFLPAVVSNVLESKLPFPILHLVASILSWTSAVINPLVYSLLHHQYKEVSSALLNGRVLVRGIQQNKI